MRLPYNRIYVLVYCLLQVDLVARNLLNMIFNIGQRFKSLSYF